MFDWILVIQGSLFLIQFVWKVPVCYQMSNKDENKSYGMINMEWKQKYYWYAFFFLYLWQVCNPTRKHQHYSRNQHNSIIYAKVGESINISCWFDPNSLTLLTRSRFRPADFVIDDDDDDTWSRGRTKRDLRRQQKKRNTDAQANRYFSRKSFTADNHDGGGDNDDEERSEIYNKPSFRLDEAKENNWDKKVANRYELDWYFWDKDGKFKIIRFVECSFIFWIVILKYIYKKKLWKLNGVEL